MRTAVQWNDLTRRQIAERLTEAGHPVSRNIVGQLLDKSMFHHLDDGESRD